MFGYEFVEAPKAQPPRYGVVAAFPTPDTDSALWANGITFNPEACAPGGIGGGLDCLNDGPNMSADGGGNPDVVESDAFILWAADQCSALASTGRDFEGRARRNLASSESFFLASELWEGGLGLVGRRFADGSADTVTAAAVAPGVAVGMLEWALGRCNHGRRGMIHVTPQVLYALVEGQGVTNAGGLWISPMGNIVVADAGYTGATPAGVAATTSQYAYATSMIYLRLGAVELLRSDLADQVDWRVNTRRVIAWRPAVFEWDECCLLAAQVNVAVPAGLNL